MTESRGLMTLVGDALRHEGGLVRLLGKSVRVLFSEGISGIGLRVTHLRLQRQQGKALAPAQITYREWVEREYGPDDASLAAATIAKFNRLPLISVICPTFNPNEQFLRAAIQSMQGQVYPHWQLCIADDCSTSVDVSRIVAGFNDSRITLVQREQNGNISAASNSALDTATGDYVTFLDQDDTLSPFALFWVAELLVRRPDVRLIYSDEDKLSEEGERCDPHFKPDWNYDYLLAHNYLCHLSVYDRQLVEQVGRLRLGFEGAQDHDLALRAIEQLKTSEIAHIPRVLYHWRKHEDSTSMSVQAKPYALVASKRAVEEHLTRTASRARVSLEGLKFRILREIPTPLPRVNVLIPTRDGLALLRACINSILQKTRYPNYRITVIDNGSAEAATLRYLEEGAARGDFSVTRDDQPFNFSRLVNTGIRASDDEYVCLLNNDVEVISDGWLTEMMGNACRDEVGVVGAKLLYDDNTVQHGGVILGVGGVAGHAHKYQAQGSLGYFDRLVLQHELSAVTGACMLIKRSVFDQTRGFDESELTVAFNDVDYCLQVRELGYKIIWTPHAVLYHHESKSRGLEDTEEKQARFQKEAEAMLARWGAKLQWDPAYNPNLSLETEDFGLAPSSRVPTLREIAANPTLQQHHW
ncbi:MAG: glycosyltransferase [Pseudomonadota bacterium]